MWARGDQVVLRFRWEGRLSWVEPVTVVEDSPDCIALYLAMDTPIKRPVREDGLPIPRFQTYETPDLVPWRLGDAAWQEHAVLWLVRPGAAHAIGLFWRGVEREFVGWYGNLQAPLVRTAIGFDTTDHVLDVQIAPDRSWNWKDEDEFAVVQHQGRISPADAVAIRAEGERVIAALMQGGWPFDTGWEHWQPDATWPIPAIPDWWDVAGDALPAEHAAITERVPVGASAIIIDDDGRVLLVKHTYGRHNWELPGGHTEPGEPAVETALREVREETGLRVSAQRLVGIYYEPEVDMHHFVFMCRRLDDVQTPEPDGVEISECRYWAADALPRPISDFTIDRVRQALSGTPVTSIITVPPRLWFD